MLQNGLLLVRDIAIFTNAVIGFAQRTNKKLKQMLCTFSVVQLWPKKQRTTATVTVMNSKLVALLSTTGDTLENKLAVCFG